MDDQKLIRYSDTDLAEFSSLIAGKITEIQKNCTFLTEQLSGNAHGTDDTSFDFEMMDSGQQMSSKENLSMQIARENKFLEALRFAEQRIKNKTYGICRVTGKLIPKERLLKVPHTTLSIEGKELLDKGII